jgi:hypothetical protein
MRMLQEKPISKSKANNLVKEFPVGRNTEHNRSDLREHLEQNLLRS